MKTKIMTAAIALMAITATTASADRLARNNVACDGGSVYGFTVQSYGLTHYVAERNLSYCPEGTIGVPASVDIYEPTEVVAWLATQGVEITDVQLRNGHEIRLLVVDGNGDQSVHVRERRPVNGGW